MITQIAKTYWNIDLPYFHTYKHKQPCKKLKIQHGEGQMYMHMICFSKMFKRRSCAFKIVCLLMWKYGMCKAWQSEVVFQLSHIQGRNFECW